MTDQKNPEGQPMPEHVKAFVERAAPLREKFGEEEFAAAVNQPVFTPEMASALYESEHGPSVAFHLGKNTAEANRIASLPPDQMLREIGRLEGRFSQAPERVSEAPDPISPVRGTAGPEKDPEKMSTAEWMQWDRARQAEKKRLNPFA